MLNKGMKKALQPRCTDQGTCKARLSQDSSGIAQDWQQCLWLVEEVEYFAEDLDEEATMSLRG